MAWPDELSVALKEWQVVCDALLDGRQIVLLRKGGIYEAGGEFEIEHREFLLFPTYLHQKQEMVKDEERGKIVAASDEPQIVEISGAGVITDIVRVGGREEMERIFAEHIWARPLIEMRFNYRPENPLYLLVVRAYRLAEAAAVSNTPAYAGCKSWVPLTEGIATRGAKEVMSDGEFEAMRLRIVRDISGQRPRGSATIG